MIKKKFFFFLCIYKMYLILAEGYKDAAVYLLIIKKTAEIWPSMKDVEKGMGVNTSWWKWAWIHII